MKNLLLLVVSLLTIGSLNAQSWENVFFDDFNRPDGELGEDYEVGVYNGSVTIANNEVLTEASDIETFYWVVYWSDSLDIENVKLSAYFRCNSANPNGEAAFALIKRCDNLSYAGGVNTGTDSIGIFLLDSVNNMEYVAGDVLDLIMDSLYLIEFDIQGAVFNLKVTEVFSGEEVEASYTNPTVPTGNKLSLNGYQDAGVEVYFDDFKIDTLSTENINDLTKSLSEVLVYPNPAKDIIAIKNLNNIENTTIKIYSTTGTLVKEEQLSKDSEIDISEMPRGMYILTIVNENHLNTTKFIKE